MVFFVCNININYYVLFYLNKIIFDLKLILFYKCCKRIFVLKYLGENIEKIMEIVLKIMIMVNC